jgi:hypothetical protein
MSKKVLTEGDIQTIRQRWRSASAHADIELLNDEITRVSDALTDVWLLMDEIAREGGIVALRAQNLLQAQGAPGWKKQ